MNGNSESVKLLFQSADGQDAYDGTSGWFYFYHLALVVYGLGFFASIPLTMHSLFLCYFFSSQNSMSSCVSMPPAPPISAGVFPNVAAATGEGAGAAEKTKPP